jgi:UDP-4-amino-4,6-dideoxy-N-acetyl-beta-L-altrosamine N-acetyltransferase
VQGSPDGWRLLGVQHLGKLPAIPGFVDRPQKRAGALSMANTGAKKCGNMRQSRPQSRWGSWGGMSKASQPVADLERGSVVAALPRQIVLREILSLDQSSQLRIREIRNEPSIRKVMYTDHEIQLDEHQDWLGRLKQDKCRIAFAVIDEKSGPIGMVGLNSVDWRHRRSDWAFYLTEGERGGLGAALEYSLLEFAFNRLELEKLNCEVIEGNDAVVRLHKKFGFEEEGFRRSNIEKGGIRIGVHFLGLQKSTWSERKATVRKEYEPVLQKFRITIDWQRQ